MHTSSSTNGAGTQVYAATPDETNVVAENTLLALENNHPDGAPTRTSGTHGTHHAAPPLPTVNLSPDALMAYCQSRLHSLDSQMSAIFAKQQGNATLTQDVNNIASMLNDLPLAAGSSDSNPTMSGANGAGQRICAAYAQASKDALAEEIGRAHV